ncbi:MAG TPA: FecR family protein [Candidatus Dormibacteraeota bacterium]|nr:FecR family protein [Candidatus Dormibacteraeota bacterium]
MAIEPPPAPVAPPATQPAGPPPAAKSSGCFGRGCGCGCGGCLLVFVLAVLLAAGGGWYFLVVQASAAVTAPATLVVFNQTVTVNGDTSIPGQALNANDEVKTAETGHAAIQFPDGSYVRMSPSTDVRITSVQLQRTGNLQSAEVLQKAGRTLVNVQHLVNGATFKIDGHSVSAQVRGTQFEVLVNANLTNLIKVFIGAVLVAGGGRQVTVNAGQEITGAANGTLGAPRPIQPDPSDAYPLIAQCTSAVSSGTTSGTLQVTAGEPITTGAAPEVDYDSPGGAVSVALCYPGSFMTLSVFTPDGVEHASRQSGSPVTAHIAGAAGHYRAVVHAVDVARAEAFAVAFATDAPCVASTGDTGGASVREMLSNSQIADALAQSGSSGVTIQVQGTSPTSAHVVYFSDIGGIAISWTIDFYAATPNLGAVITSVTVRGINVTTEVLKRLGSLGVNSISSIPSGFTVDRVYSCNSATGDTMMVIEGHR